jgi:pimeloyl-ACP methyl ester carboxylesterase
LGKRCEVVNIVAGLARLPAHGVVPPVACQSLAIADRRLQAQGRHPREKRDIRSWSMAYAHSEGSRIYYEETGIGEPLLFIHEFGGDHRSWTDQVRYFSRHYRCITFSARGYPPSDVPDAERSYGQEIANRDALAVLDAAGIERAHICGLSMGGYTALQLAIHHPRRVRGVVAAGAGSGAHPATRTAFIADANAAAAAMEAAGHIGAEQMGVGPTRVQLQNKDPQGWRRMVEHIAEHPAKGSARVLRNVQAKRASLYDLERELRMVSAPVLLIVGDEDEPCLDVNLWMKRLMPTADLALLPGSGHVVNYEEPALFNLLVERFLSAVDRGSWRPRDRRAIATASGTFASTLGGRNE